MKDPFIREKLTKEQSFARQLAKEYFEKYPKDRYQTEVELARASVPEYRVHHEAVERTAEIMPWSRAFEDPIPLPGGRTLRTLRDAASHVMALPGKTRQSDEWQAAIEALLMAAEDRGPLMHARIGVLRAGSGCLNNNSASISGASA